MNNLCVIDQNVECLCLKGPKLDLTESAVLKNETRSCLESSFPFGQLGSCSDGWSHIITSSICCPETWNKQEGDLPKYPKGTWKNT